MAQFAAGSRPGRYEEAAPDVSSSADAEVIKRLWKNEVLPWGMRLVVIPRSLREQHGARLHVVLPEHSVNAAANGCHEMRPLSSSCGRALKEQRFHCLFRLW